jgi:hypothetical protein
VSLSSESGNRTAVLRRRLTVLRSDLPSVLSARLTVFPVCLNQVAELDALQNPVVVLRAGERQVEKP